MAGTVMRVPGRLLLSRDINKYCRFIWRNSSTANFNRCGRANDSYQSERCLGVTSGILAYSAHCQTDLDGRPVAGVMVICRDLLSKEGFSNEHMTVIHELFHVLGFSKELFSFWRDCSLSSQMAVGSCSYGQVTNTDETGQKRLYTPGVIKALQAHFNTTHTEMGAPLENQDAGSHGVSSHWEARVLQGSIMTALLVEPSLVQIDPITLSALQDTGWYSVNLGRAQSLMWGENEGALFGSLTTCHKPSAFFCMGSELGCHYLHLHKGACQSDQYLDGCRIYKPLANASECWKEENSRGSSVEEWSGEIFYTDSRCFFSSLVRKDHSSHSVSVAGRCYRHRCTGRNRYQIQVVGSEWLDCPAGKSIQVYGYRGTIFCPDKRLCYYYSVVPPTSTPKPLPSTPHPSIHPSSVHSLIQRPLTSQHSLNFGQTPPFSASADCAGIAMVTVLSISAVLCLLATAMAFYRKCCSVRVRVHAVVEVPYML
ncbi:leishmanolysin-like peptidase 2 [Electrophorus electricus]|uniref:leishmanolysin-like peptidase 2 n=1 Tax=Electrophorus electricus TaxID=8005 RepID=UPI0015D087E7|nr:leishmanolysin-like peptidase 2 [Electrophorus electricus]